MPGSITRYTVRKLSSSMTEFAGAKNGHSGSAAEILGNIKNMRPIANVIKGNDPHIRVQEHSHTA